MAASCQELNFSSTTQDCSPVYAVKDFKVLVFTTVLIWNAALQGWRLGLYSISYFGEFPVWKDAFKTLDVESQPCFPILTASSEFAAAKWTARELPSTARVDARTKKFPKWRQASEPIDYLLIFKYNMQNKNATKHFVNATEGNSYQR